MNETEGKCETGLWESKSRQAESGGSFHTLVNSSYALMLPDVTPTFVVFLHPKGAQRNFKSG